MLCRSFDDLDHFDTILAEFRPLRTDDLKPGVARFIGQVAEWQALWIVEDHEGVYRGQWAMQPMLTPATQYLWPFAWAPQCDLRIVGEG